MSEQSSHLQGNSYPGQRGRRRKIIISIFVILWTLVFHYESTRHFLLNPWASRQLPKIKFLFPPAGWIMFFNVDEAYGGAEVYGLSQGQPQLIDPHKILETKAIGYDNIHRNVLSEVLSPYRARSFCGFLKRKFPEFNEFTVVATYYPSVVKEPQQKLYKTMYVCP